MKIKLIMEMEFEPNGTPFDELKERIERITTSMIDEARLTEDTSAVFVGWSGEIEEVEST